MFLMKGLNHLLSKNEKYELKKFRHLAAVLIEESLGYFTPAMALYAIKCQKHNEVNGCEWYYHMATLKLRNSGKTKTSSKDFDKALLQVNHDTIKRAFKRRHIVNLKRSLKIVDYNINGSESIGASWF